MRKQILLLLSILLFFSTAALGEWNKIDLSSVSTDLSSWEFNAVYFINTSEGYAVGTTSEGSATGGVILKSTNGGADWSRIYDYAWELTDVQFLNTQQGYVAGEDVLKTTDGGATFTKIFPSNLDGVPRGLYFLNSREGWVVSAFSSTYEAFYTSDGGGSFANYDVLTATPESGGLFAVYAADSSNVWAVGSNNSGTAEAYKFDGASWSLKYSGDASSTFYDVKFVNSSAGWIVDGGSISRTADGGTTFAKVSVIWAPTLRGVDFVDNQIVWAAGEGFPGPGGSILRSADGGSTWVDDSPSASTDQFDDIQMMKSGNYVYGWAVGQKGQIFRYVSEPAVTSVEANFLNKNVSNQSLIIKGSGFISGATFEVTPKGFASGAVLTVESVSVDNTSQATLKINLASPSTLEETGALEVSLYNPDGSFASFEASGFIFKFEPYITAIAAKNAYIGQTAEVVVNGVNFVATPGLVLTRESAAISLTSVNWLNSAKVTAEAYFPSSEAAGTWTLTLTNPNGATAVGYLTIEALAAPAPGARRQLQVVGGIDPEGKIQVQIGNPYKEPLEVKILLVDIYGRVSKTKFVTLPPGDKTIALQNRSGKVRAQDAGVSTITMSTTTDTGNLLAEGIQLITVVDPKTGIVGKFPIAVHYLPGSGKPRATMAK